MTYKHSYLEIDRQMVGGIYTVREVMANLTVLCDDFDSRFTGTPQKRTAAEFIADTFSRYGLKSVHLPSYPYAGWTRGQATLEVVELIPPCNPLYLAPLFSTR